MIAAVLFDMDGTLVDSDAAVERVWATWARRRGVDPAEVARHAPGRQAVHALVDLAPWMSAEERAADSVRMLEQEYVDLVDVVAAPGARELLALLDARAVPYAVVTSADARLAAARLGAAGLVAPPVTVTASDVRRGKPDPEGYREAARRLGVEPSDCLVVEDSPAGVGAGRAAGARVVGLRGVAGSDLDVPDLHALRLILTADAARLSAGTPCGPGPAPSAGACRGDAVRCR